MIFRRRRTRIELEQTTVKMKAGGAISAAARPVVVTPTAPSPVESVLARVLPFPVPGPTELVVDRNDFPATVPPEAKLLPNALQETLP
jgi:hypothetical protein